MTATAALKAVIFDCDGILVNTEPLHYRAFQEVLVPLGLGHDFNKYMARYIGFDDRDAFIEAFGSAGLPMDEVLLGQLVKAKEQALREIVAQGLDTFPGVVELVRDLASHGVPLAVASGALRVEVRHFIESLGLRELFSVIVAADDVAKSKPDPETYLVALDQLGKELDDLSVDPGRVIAIEDTPAGIRSAKAAGLYVIAVTNSFPRERLDDADCVVDSLERLDYGRLVSMIEHER